MMRKVTVLALLGAAVAVVIGTKRATAPGLRILNSPPGYEPDKQALIDIHVPTDPAVRDRLEALFPSTGGRPAPPRYS